MKEFCHPSTKSTNKIKLVFSDLGFVSSFFLFFFPLLLPFFSPLLITIFILLLALVYGIFFSASGFSSLMENLRPRFEERHDLELQCFEDFQACKTVSRPPTVDMLGVESASDAPYLDHAGVLGDSDAPGKWQQNPDEEELELRSSSINGGNHTKQNHIIKTQSLRHGRVLLDTDYENPHAPEHIISHTLSDLGSTRREKEWRRTLACKLFQERHNVGGGVGGGEGMDRLWEVYERTEEQNRGKQREVSNVKQGESRISKSRIVDYLEELEEEEGEDANLCCLKALKFSAGKMQFGMPKPGILNFSKAFKGVKSGWLNHHHHRKKKV